MRKRARGMETLDIEKESKREEDIEKESEREGDIRH